MKSQVFRLVTIAPVCALLLGSNPVEAACASLSLCSCTVTATDVTFGMYNPVAVGNTNINGTIRVQCTLLVALAGSYTISLSSGTSGVYNPRTLVNGPFTLSYNLYTTVGHSQIWGDGSGGSSFVTQSFAALLGIDQSVSVYGQIPAMQNVPAGNYNDNITVTVNY